MTRFVCAEKIWVLVSCRRRSQWPKCSLSHSTRRTFTCTSRAAHHFERRYACSSATLHIASAASSLVPATGRRILTPALASHSALFVRISVGDTRSADTVHLPVLRGSELLAIRVQYKFCYISVTLALNLLDKSQLLSLLFAILWHLIVLYLYLYVVLTVKLELFAFIKFIRIRLFGFFYHMGRTNVWGSITKVSTVIQC